MSTFRDTFTKEQKKDSLLDYDDSAFLYFAAAGLTCVLVPWTWKVLKSVVSPESTRDLSKSTAGSTYKFCQCSACVTRIENMKKEQQRWSTRLSWLFWLQVVVLAILWVVLILVAFQCTGTREIQSFDPFEILEISQGSTDKQIKKAYRVMSLKYHPDKNPNDPTAGARFVMISKAYQALTDEVAKRNYEKYGNPDGPGVMKVGIGLPRFLVEEDYQLFNILIFFTLLLVVVPMGLLWTYRNIKRYASNGIQIETLQFLSYYMNEGTRIKNGPEYLAASAESREIPLRSTDQVDMQPLAREVVEPRKRQFSSPNILRSYFLILGHMQRLHKLMTPALRKDLDTLLGKSMLITTSMLELSFVSNWFLTAQSMIEFQRSLIHGLGFKSSPFLQIPHVDEEILRQFQRVKGAPKSLIDFIHQSPDARKAIGKMNQLQLADVGAFCAHVSDMELEATVFVDDENEIVVGDFGTISVKLTRKNLQEGEAMGPIHAPLFPELKYEAWWMCATDKISGNLLGFTKSRSPERVIEEKITFEARRPGKNELTVTCFSDSINGIDKSVDIKYKVLTEKEAGRQVFVHPEDEALDDEPTLFQQMIGTLGAEDSSDDEAGNSDEYETEDSAGETQEQGRSENSAAPNKEVAV